jgi:hypothetical protein
MPVSTEKRSGTSYTAPAALLILAFVFIPTILLASRPFGDIALAVAIGSSAICIGVARTNWMRSSQLAIASIADQGARTK